MGMVTISFLFSDIPLLQTKMHSFLRNALTFELSAYFIEIIKTLILKMQSSEKDVVVVGYPTPSEGWGHGGRPWSPRSQATPQGLDQRS